jgi:DNA mismatch endonuclease (patch repair protein)
MMDTRTPEKRQQIMRAVRQGGTGPELAMRSALHAAGVRGWRCHYTRAAGKPDLAWPALRVACFVDGAFWHGHPSRHKPGRSGSYWDAKIARNVQRDREVDAQLVAQGWTVVRVWDFEIRRDPQSAVGRVVSALVGALQPKSPTAAWQAALLARHREDETPAAGPQDVYATAGYQR